MSSAQPPGQVITFYSYKGGTGRSMALANFAWVLAMAGKRVLAIDWDLEAPGLHRYFHPFLSDPELKSTEGVIDFVIRFIEAASARDGDDSRSKDWYLPYARIAHYANSIDYAFQNGGLLDFIPAGKQGEAYAARVNSLNWKHFYEKLGGWSVMEEMRDSLRRVYDFILIDSRTGVSDTSGICTVQMPDIVVVCFTLNFQSIDGASAAARSIEEQRTRQDKPVRILPVPMRVEVSAEKIKYDQVSSYALRRFLPTDRPAELAGVPARSYWDDVAVPYIGFYVFEEQLAWFLDLNRNFGVLAATMRLVKYVANVDVLSLAGPDEDERKEVLAQYADVWTGRLREHAALELPDWLINLAKLRVRELTRKISAEERENAAPAPSGDDMSDTSLLLQAGLRALLLLEQRTSVALPGAPSSHDSPEMVNAQRNYQAVFDSKSDATLAQRAIALEAVELASSRLKKAGYRPFSQRLSHWLKARLDSELFSLAKLPARQLHSEISSLKRDDSVPQPSVHELEDTSILLQAGLRALLPVQERKGVALPGTPSRNDPRELIKAQENYKAVFDSGIEATPEQRVIAIEAIEIASRQLEIAGYRLFSQTLSNWVERR
jgi:cellulose biosynthesis protein BcsQ